MPLKEKYLFIVSMDVAPEKEALFNEVYDTEHVPLLSKVPGVISVSRLEKIPTRITLGGEIQTLEFPDEPKYTAIYEVTGPDVLVSDAWAEAGEKGRWATDVRPHTFNRRHIVRKVIG
jgi:hypothetical protein